MIRNIKKWLKDHDNITRKTAGLEEKERARKKTLEVAMSILNRRSRDISVPFERRVGNSNV